MEFAKLYGVKIGFKGLKSQNFYTEEIDQITKINNEEREEEKKQENTVPLPSDHSNPHNNTTTSVLMQNTSILDLQTN